MRKSKRWFVEIDYDANPDMNYFSIRSFIQNNFARTEITGNRVICNDIDDALRLRMSLDENVVATGHA